MNTGNNIHIRPMTVDDLEQVCEVEKKSFRIPWTREAFNNELTQNHFARYAVVETDDRVIGYCGMWMIVDEAHITNIALLPEYRGRGIGEHLLKDMIRLAQMLGCNRMTLEVRVSNRLAQRLYEKMGFVIKGKRPKYYTDNMEDAYIMWVELNEQ
jgi:ribosomal-protein-alanine N-acetyltransferase